MFGSMVSGVINIIIMDLSTPIIPGPSPSLQLDIFHYILDHLVVQDSHRGSEEIVRKTLSALAQTCRALSELSLDYLWRKLKSIKPLVRCFALMRNEDRIMLPLSPAEWGIIRRYSRRIRELKVDSYERETYWFLRATSSQPGLLLPNLRVLSWSPLPVPHVSLVVALLKGLLSPSLVSVNLVLRDLDDVLMQSFLANLHQLCPNLQSIDIFKNPFSWTASQMTVRSLSRTIPFLQDIESVCISVPIDNVALTHLATTPKVKKLNIVLHPEHSRLHQFHPPPDTILFSNVKDLSVRIWDLGFLTALLHKEAQAFYSFCLNLHTRPTIHALSTLLDALLTPQRTHSLQHISLRVYLYNGARPQVTTAHTWLSYDTLRPLARLSHLRELHISFDRCLVIDDDELISLVDHWPLLDGLELHGCGGPHEHLSQSDKHITLDGLLSLLECRPRLRSLSLAIDASEVPINNPQRTACNHALTSIQFYNSRIESPEPVAQFLYELLPSLRNVDASFDRVYPHDDMLHYMRAWHRVQTVIKELVAGKEGTD